MWVGNDLYECPRTVEICRTSKQGLLNIKGICESIHVLSTLSKIERNVGLDRIEILKSDAAGTRRLEIPL